MTASERLTQLRCVILSNLGANVDHYPALESSAPEVDSSPASWSTSSSSSSSVVPDSSLEEE